MQRPNRHPRRIKWGYLIAGLILLALGLMGVGAPPPSAHGLAAACAAL